MSDSVKEQIVWACVAAITIICMTVCTMDQQRINAGKPADKEVSR